MGKQPSSSERRATQAEEMITAVRTIVEEQRKWISQQLADVQGYSTGALEQLMFQQGQMMTVQAGIIEYLQELSQGFRPAVGAEERIHSIVEQNIAKAKAERAEREAAEAAKKDAPPEGTTVGQSLTVGPEGAAIDGHPIPREQTEAILGAPVVEAVLPANIAPEAPAVAPPDTSGA